MNQLEKLGEFFSKFGVVLDNLNFDYNPVHSGRNCVLVDFNAGDINLTARRGLSWAGRMGFKRYWS